MRSRGDKESFGCGLSSQADVADSGKSAVAVRRESSAVPYHMGYEIMKVYYEKLAEKVEILEVILPTKEKSEFSCRCRVNRRKGSKKCLLKHRWGDAKECGGWRRETAS